MVYGATVEVPMNVFPLKNCTELIVPSGSLAVAATLTVAGSANDAPGAGEIMATLGGWFGGGGGGGGSNGTVTLCTREPLTRFAFVTVSRTEYVPATAYVWVVDAPVPVCPSPKFQL